MLTQSPQNVDQPMNVIKEEVVTTPEVETPTEALTYFQKHYVNFGGLYARIPLKFCRSSFSFDTECEITQSYREIDLREHPLPVSEILSAATDVNNRIVFAKTSTNKDEIGCMVPDLYSYNLKGDFKKLKNDSSMWKCGAIGSYIESLSPGGRYARIVATGGTSAYGSWLYDVDNDVVDTQVVHSNFVAFLSSEEGDRDRYVLYLGGCEKEPYLSMFPECKQTLSLRDNRTGKAIAITPILDALKEKGIVAESITRASYSPDDDELYLGTEELAHDLLVPNFKRFFQGLE